MNAAAVLLALALPCRGPAQSMLPGGETDGALRKIGDILHIALPATAGATTVVKRDWEGAIQFGTVFGASVGTFVGAKRLISKDRPDASDARSFPSGHTAMSFAGSTFMLNRYGKKVGIPLMLTAGFVGFTRVKGQKHFADDVIAGAGVGVLYNMAFAKRFPKRVFLKPVSFQSGGSGMQMQIDVGDRAPAPGARPAEAEKSAYRIEFEYAALFTRDLAGQAPSGVGTPLTLDEDERTYSPTSRFQFDWLFRDPHELSLTWAPFEARDFQRVATQPFQFAGVDFNVGDETVTRFRYDEVLARYRYRLIDNRRLDLRLGAALSFREITAEIEQPESELEGEVTDYGLLPLFHLRFQLQLHPKFGLIGQSDAIYLTDKRYSVASQLGFNWRLNYHWDFTFGYRWFLRKIDGEDLKTRLRFDYYTAGIGYSF